MKKIVSGIFIILHTVGFSQNILWDGGAGNSDWSAPANWNPDGVPGATDQVEIPYGDTVEIFQGPQTIKYLKLQAFTQLIIHEGTALQILNSTAAGLEGSGLASKVVNQGTLVIQDAGTDGLLIYGTFTNDSTGVIEILNPGNYGIVTGTNDTLINNGNISILGSGNHGIYNTGTVTNLDSGRIQVENSGSYGIRNGSNDFLNNHGTLTISGSVNFGLENSGYVTNHPDATIQVTKGSEIGLNNRNRLYNAPGGTILIVQTGDGFGDYGLNNDLSDTLINAGFLSITHAADDAIHNRGYFRNESTGIVEIDTSGQDHPGYAIYVGTGYTLVNAGSILIDGASDHGIYNLDSMNNLPGALLQVENMSKSGILNSTGGILRNGGSVNIGSCQEYGIRNYHQCINEANGSMTFQNCLSGAIRNEFSDLFDNLGEVTIHANGINQIMNQGMLLIRTGGTINVLDAQ